MSHIQDQKATVDQAVNQHDSASFANPAPSSLFPAYAAASGQQATGWLQNASFPVMSAPKQTEAGTADQAARSMLAKPCISASILPQFLQPWNLPNNLLPASGLRLQQAAEQLLPSSSSDSEAEATADGQDPSDIPAAPRHAAQALDLDSGSDEASHRKRKRRRESAKHKKSKKHRSAAPVHLYEPLLGYRLSPCFIYLAPHCMHARLTDCFGCIYSGSSHGIIASGIAYICKSGFILCLNQPPSQIREGVPATPSSPAHLLWLVLALMWSICCALQTPHVSLGESM